MESQRIKVLCWRWWPLLLVVIHQLFRTCLAGTDPCPGIIDVNRVSYGNPTFLRCEPNPSYPMMLTGSFEWYQNAKLLEESPEEPQLKFDDSILDVLFIESRREGVYECSYQQDGTTESRVNGTSDPMCLIVRGIPEFLACPDLGINEKCEIPNEHISFYTDEELEVQVEVKYVGAGGGGFVFEVVGVSIARTNFDTLMICTTELPSTEGSAVDFSCNPMNEDRINGSVLTDRTTYMNASFVINSARVNDSGKYTVRVTGRDTSEATMTISSIPTTTTIPIHTILTLILTASATVRSPTLTSSISIPGTASTSTVIQSTSTAPMPPQATPTSSVSIVSTGESNDAIIVGVSVVAGIIILILLLGIVSVCLFILHGMCPKLKKQIMDNVRLITLKQNGREDVITVITEGTTMQNAKQYSQPQFELPDDKNSKSAVV